jgi:hypothetical protein
VPLEGKVRVQLNLRVERAKHVQTVENFRDFVFPIMWLEEVRIHLNIISKLTGVNRNEYLINMRYF